MGANFGGKDGYLINITSIDMATASTVNFHKAIALFFNAAIVVLTVYFVIKTDSDKSPLIFMFCYPLLLLANLMILLVLLLFKRKEAKIYKQVLLGLLLLFIPLVMFISKF